MMKRILLLAAAVLLLTAAPASAQDPYADDDTIAVSDATVTPGQPITLSAKTFMPGTTVTFTMFSAPVVLGTATADANGVATITVTIPANTTPGTHRIEASGTGIDGQPLTVVTTIQVAGTATAPGSSGLPTTGSDSVSLTQVAVAVMVFGGLMVVMANKRRSAKTERDTVGI